MHHLLILVMSALAALFYWLWMDVKWKYMKCHCEQSSYSSDSCQNYVGKDKNEYYNLTLFITLIIFILPLLMCWYMGKHYRNEIGQ